MQDMSLAKLKVHESRQELVNIDYCNSQVHFLLI